ncbi:MAG: TIGR04283 family arsenosugar biosynthesis glycosyltransferase [Fluviicola sp.]
MNLSVIIPTLNEESFIGRTLDLLLTPENIKNKIELIVVDGGSKDKTIEIAKQFPVKVIESPQAGRAVQMNLGAEHATGDYLYFVHADTKVLPGFFEDLRDVKNKGVKAACYRFKFDKDSRALRFNAYFTRFNRMFCRGGDQTLFMCRDLFQDLGGFDTSYVIMEDFDMVRRIKKKTRFHIIPKSVTVSARKYEHNSYFRVNRANLIAYWMFMLGYPSERIKNHYHNAIRHPKDT